MSDLANAYRPDGLDRLAEAAMKLDALASLVSQAQDLGIVGRDGLGLIFADIALNIEKGVAETRRQMSGQRA
jgi:hypothetical protein